MSAPESPCPQRPRVATASALAATIAFAVAALGGRPASAQQLTELRTGFLPAKAPTARTTADIATGDVDGDGDVDAVLAVDGVRLLLNGGDGAFVEAPAGSLPAVDDVFSVALGDVDGDGDLDMVLGRATFFRGGQNRLYLNDGTGRFVDGTAGRFPTMLDATSDVALADVDGDQDLDVVVANDTSNPDCGGGFGCPEQNRLYLNDGTARFTDVTATHMPPVRSLTAAVVAADFDGDGDTDLYFGNRTFFLGASPQDRLYLNDGTGRFADVTTTRLPPLPESTNELVAVDVEGDGDFDVVAVTGLQDRLLLNDGTGTFTDATSSRLPPDTTNTSAVAADDVDRDGDPDLVLGKVAFSRSRDVPNRLLLNDGSGRFTDATASRMPDRAKATHAAAVADFDGDGDSDLMFGEGDELDSLYWNDGAGRFVDMDDEAFPRDADGTFAIALGDVDRDGDLDVAIGNLDFSPNPPRGEPNRLYLNDGRGAFTDVTATLPGTNDDRTRALALVDVDGDSDLDLFSGNWGQSRLLRNLGSGQFTDVTAGAVPAETDFTSAVAVGDVDGDGDVDLLLGSGDIDFYPHQMVGQQNRLWLNAGGGVFQDATAARLPVDADPTAGAALGDVDGDGDLDAAFANMGVQNRLLLNDGSGAFADASATHMPADQDHSRVAAFGDVDGDGDLDLMFANGTTGVPQRDTLYLNDGTGRFTDVTAARMPATSGTTYALVLGDTDLDGDLDAVVGTGYPGDLPVRIYANDGTGRFAVAASAIAADNSRYTNALAVGDLDRDGDLEVISGNQYRRNRLLVNLYRQVHAPQPARTGFGYELRYLARPGSAPSQQIAIPFFNLRDLTPGVPLPPLGVIGIDPNGAVPLPLAFLPAPQGVATLRFPFPANPALRGLTGYTQAVMLHSAQLADWRLTNVEASPIH